MTMMIIIIIEHLKYKSVCCNADMEGIGFAPTLSLGPPLFHTAKIGQHLEAWTPLFELYLPIQEYTGGDHHKMWSPHSSVTGQVGQK